MNEEKRIENRFIEHLQELKYTYRKDICDKDSLNANFRKKFEFLNRVHLTDAEFSRLKEEIITDDVYKNAKILRERNTFFREDGTPLQYILVNIKDWCKNDYEVINQLRINTENSHHRYDVIILINGIPVVQIELKATQISPRVAIKQIVDYKNDNDNGYKNSLLCFMQMFIVSNENNTYYFANNNNCHFNFNAEEQFLPVYQLADKKNRKISELNKFTECFLPKCVLGEMISRYMVLVATEKKILLMRPYQIYAVKAIMDCIKDGNSNGYIWHTTGSGKTLTSFKTSTLLKDNENIDKCLFVVDRKDLDRQTREEFNKFQENCVEENTNTNKLVRRLLSDDYADKVIVTTIQKLGIALDPKNKKNYIELLEEIKDQRFVFIFDECHRSQFGDNHKAIKEFFPNSQMFGFTGTPIFEKNAVQVTREGEEARYMITDDVFNHLLHSYTITDAIEDRNVLRFHIDYFAGEADVDEKTRKLAVIDNIINKHKATSNSYEFNALLATDSISDAIEYYKLFKTEQDELQRNNEDYQVLNIGCVFSPPATMSDETKQMQEDLQQEKEDYKVEPDKKKKALDTIIDEYDKKYGTNFSINDFDGYYQDVQQRIKNQKFTNSDYPHKNKLDIVIVVDMLLTGFDSKYLNTLYVDKNLKHHGLIQAFSRTNRVLNDTKPFGNILDHKGQQKAVDEAMELFTPKDEDYQSVRKIWLVDPAPKVIDEYKQAVNKLQQFMTSEGLEFTSEAANNIKGDEARLDFIKCFKEVQRYKTQLDQYTDLSVEDKEVIKNLIPEEECRGFKGIYLETANHLRKKSQEGSGSVEEEVKNYDFEFVLFASAIIDYDYIMKLLAKFQNNPPKGEKWEVTKDKLIKFIASTSTLMDEQDDIIEYINSLGEIQGVTETTIKEGYIEFKQNKYDGVLSSIAKNYSIEYNSLKEFVEKIIDLMKFDDGELTNLLAPLGLGWKARTQIKLELMDKLIPVLNKMANDKEISGLVVYEKQQTK